MATKTAIIALSQEEILVWAIPPLSPQPPDFFDHNPTHIPPLLGIKFPDVILPHTELDPWKTISPWYFGSSQPLYFNILGRDSKLHWFKIIVKPDLYDTSLHVINAEVAHIFDNDDVFLQPYSICEDTLVACWDETISGQSAVFAGTTSSLFANVISHVGPAAGVLLSAAEYPYSLCPSSGRIVCLHDDRNRIVVVDFLR